jgi:hypothetical protein
VTARHVTISESDVFTLLRVDYDIKKNKLNKIKA